MRILMLVENNPYPQDPRVRNEAVTLRRAGHEVTVIAPRAKGQRRVDRVEDVAVYRYATPPEVPGAVGYLVEYGYAAIAMTILSFVALFRNGFDVVHAHNPPDTLALIGALHRLWGKRFVYDLHDLSPEMYRARFRTDREGPLYRALQQFERLSFRLADHVIATNDSYAAIARDRGGVPADRVTVVRNGPDLGRVRRTPPDPELRRSSAFLIGYVGVMGRQDGVDYLLRALRSLRDDLGRDAFRCIVVGRGDAMPELRALRSELGLEEHVRFPGYVPDEELMRILSTVDLFVAPEPRNDFNDQSTMIKMTEYLVFGTPIVAFDLKEHRVTAGDAAAYAVPNDERDFARKIAAFMDDPERGRRAARVAEARLPALTWEAQAPSLLRAYAALETARREDPRTRDGERPSRSSRRTG